MISGGRSDRRIGPPGLTERLREAVSAPVLIIGVGILTATAVLFIRLAFGGALWPQMVVWPLTFSAISGAIGISLLFTRRWIQAAVAIVLIVLIFFLAKALMVPVFSAIMGYEGAVIVPVNP